MAADESESTPPMGPRELGGICFILTGSNRTLGCLCTAATLRCDLHHGAPAEVNGAKNRLSTKMQFKPVSCKEIYQMQDI